MVCNEEHRFYVAAALQQKGVSGTILLEPKGRNTAPAIALAAFAALSGGVEPLLLVLPSDHVLKPQDVFAEAVARAAPAPSPGVSLHSASRRMHRKQGSGISAGVGRCPRAGMLWRALWKNRISPEPEAMLADGGYLWNSGMFLFRASIYLEELALHAPGHSWRRARRRGKGTTPIRLYPSRRRRLPEFARRLHRLRGDGKDGPGRRGPSDSRLERSRVMGSVL